MSHISTLQTLGLTEDEARTYLALLKFGGVNALALAKEVGLKRTTIYPILKSLHEKGFASTYFHKSKRLYRAEKPDKVAGQFEKRLESFNAIIPELKSVEKQTVSTVGLRFIETICFRLAHPGGTETPGPILAPPDGEAHLCNERATPLRRPEQRRMASHAYPSV